MHAVCRDAPEQAGDRCYEVGPALCCARRTYLAAQYVGGSFEGTDWAMDGHCVRCWGEVLAHDSWLLIY